MWALPALTLPDDPKYIVSLLAVIDLWKLGSLAARLCAHTTRMATAGQKVSPSIALAGAEAPLLDLATVAQRVRTLETTPDRATLHALATREPTSFHQATIYYGLVRPDTPPRRRFGLLAASIGIVFLQCFVASGLANGVSTSTCSEQADCSGGRFCEDGLCDWCEAVHNCEDLSGTPDSLVDLHTGAKVDIRHAAYPTRQTPARFARVQSASMAKRIEKVCVPRVRPAKASKRMSTL